MKSWQPEQNWSGQSRMKYALVVINVNPLYHLRSHRHIPKPAQVGLQTKGRRKLKFHHQHRIELRKKNCTAFVGHHMMKQSFMSAVIFATIGFTVTVLELQKKAVRLCQSSSVLSVDMPEIPRNCFVCVNNLTMNLSKFLC